MATNDFQPFAAQVGANVISQATYLTLAALGPGFSSGIAYSNQLNKVWRQSSIMAAVIGSLITSITGQNATDDGTTATLAANLAQAINIQDFGADTSTTPNVYVIAQSPAPAVVLGFKVRLRPGSTNTGASTLTVNGATHPIVDTTGAALTANAIISGGSSLLEYNSSLGGWVLLESAGTGLNGKYQPIVARSTALAWSPTDGLFTFNHGQGRAPDIMRAYIQCVSANGGFAVGDQVNFTELYNTSGSVGAMMYCNATLLGCAFNGSAAYIPVSGGGTGTLLTPGDWTVNLTGIWLS